MQIIKKFEKQANYIFGVALVIHLVIMCVGYSMWDVPFRGRLLQIAFVLGCIKIFLTYYDKIEWVVMILTGLVGIGSYIATREKYVLYVVVMIFAAKSVDMRKALKAILYAVLVFSIVVIALSAFGVGDTFKQTAEFRPGIVETRYNLGFSHPNNVHGTLWYIYCLIILACKDKLDWRHYAVLESFNVAMFLITDSKAGFIVATLVLVAGVLYKYVNNICEKGFVYILGFLAFVGIIALTLVSINTCTWYGYGPIMSMLDRVTTGRISIGFNGARMSWWTMWHGYQRPDPIAVDNGFAALGNNLGYAVWSLYLLFCIAMLWISARKKDLLAFAIVVTTVMYTFMENSYTLNYVYLLSNLMYLIAMIYLGDKKGTSELCE